MSAGDFDRSETVCWWSVELRRHVTCETTVLDFTTGQPCAMRENLLIEIGGLGEGPRAPRQCPAGMVRP